MKKTNEFPHTKSSDDSLLRNSRKPVSRRKKSTESSFLRVYHSKLWPDLGYPEVDYPSSEYQRKYMT